MASGARPPAEAGIVTVPSASSVGQTVARLLQLISQRSLMLFAVVDHSGAAATAGLTMPDTKLVIFGSPAAGTPLMLAAPLVALDLPLKILIWADTGGRTFVSYTSPTVLADRHGLDASSVSPLNAIEGIVSTIAST